MDAKTISELTASLRRGELPPAQEWDVTQAVQQLVDELERHGSSLSVDEVRNAARVLNQRRRFDHTRLLAERWRATRGFDATVTKHHAQASINLLALDAAENLLSDGQKKIEASAANADGRNELPEYAGLLGRTYKQRYVVTGDSKCLQQATDQYLRQYKTNRTFFWHGINVAALLAREEDLGLTREGLSSKALASNVLEQVVGRYNKGGANQWVVATASEASLALEKCEDAELWLYRFLHHPHTQPFDLEAYARQLREIWQGDAMTGDGCASRLAKIIERHIANTEGRWSFQPAKVAAMAKELTNDPNAFEKNFSGERSFSLDAIKRLLAACASIGCVCNPAGARLGTGFLLPGNALKDSLGPEPVFVTNAHVISDSVPKAIAPNDVRVTFEVESTALKDPKFYKVAEVLFTSPPGDVGVRNEHFANLDVTIVRLDGKLTEPSSLNSAGQLPLIDPKTKVFVVGHPLGSGLQISLQDSILLDIDEHERLVHYRTPTDPGSSGSPVFNEEWEVIALHHGGSAKMPRLHGDGSYQANEGIALSAVRRAFSG